MNKEEIKKIQRRIWAKGMGVMVPVVIAGASMFYNGYSGIINFDRLFYTETNNRMLEEYFKTKKRLDSIILHRENAEGDYEEFIKNNSGNDVRNKESYKRELSSLDAAVSSAQDHVQMIKSSEEYRKFLGAIETYNPLKSIFLFLFGGSIAGSGIITSLIYIFDKRRELNRKYGNPEERQ